MDQGQTPESGGEIVVAHVPDRRRFTITVDGERAGLTAYVERGDRRIFFHTEVDERFGGRGLAGVLVAQALTGTRAAGLRIVPVCPYVAKWVTKHHDVDDALEKVTPDDLAAVREAQTR